MMCLENDKEEQDDPGQAMSYRAAEQQLVIIEFYCQVSGATGCQHNCGDFDWGESNKMRNVTQSPPHQLYIG